jgi:hypothetical protein
MESGQLPRIAAPYLSHLFSTNKSGNREARLILTIMFN